MGLVSPCCFELVNVAGLVGRLERRGSDQSRGENRRGTLSQKMCEEGLPTVSSAAICQVKRVLGGDFLPAVLRITVLRER